MPVFYTPFSDKNRDKMVRLPNILSRPKLSETIIAKSELDKDSYVLTRLS